MARPHSIVTMFTTAAVAASSRARATGRVGDFALAGTFAALAVGALQSGVCACAAVAAAWWWNSRPRLGVPLLGVGVAALAVLGSLLVLFRGDPLPDIGPAKPPGNVVLAFFGLGVHDVDERFFDGGGFRRFVLAMRDDEPVLATLAAVGPVFVLADALRGKVGRARRAVCATAAAQPLAHFALFGVCGDSFQRMWLPLIPCLAVLASFGIGAVLERATGRWRAAVVTSCAVLLSLQLAIARTGSSGALLSCSRLGPEIEACPTGD